MQMVGIVSFSMLSRKYYDDLVYKVIGCAIAVSTEMGPGLLERIYHECLLIELSERKLKFESEFPIAVQYRGKRIPGDYRCDLLVENELIVEVKSVSRILPIHEAQLMTYMSLLKKPKGLLINFNVQNIFREGQQTRVNELWWSLPDF